MSNRILVVDDDQKLTSLVRAYLERDGFSVVVAHDGVQALEFVALARPQLVVLDVMLPGLDGLTVCRRIQASTATPVILLTARAGEEHALAGLSVGADDYVTKPFSPRELVARVHAVLRRTSGRRLPDRGAVEVGDLRIDPIRHIAVRAGQRLDLTPKEFDLLWALGKEPGRAFSRVELIDIVFGPGYPGLERTIDTHIVNIRKKIELNPAKPTLLHTVFGVGYKLEPAA
jgi:DNA-binding response OmpR family regulator